MARTYTGVFARLSEFEALHAAWLKVRKGRRYNPAILEFERDLEPNLIALQESLLWRTYRTGPYRHFFVYEPKKRAIGALPIKDRIVQHALVGELEAIYYPRFIADSYAGQPGKGMHAGADRAQAMLRAVKRENGEAFALKADVSKYFASISHDALKRILRRHIADDAAIWLIDEIIDSTAEAGEVMPRGIPIGTLTSQIFANIYLHELDMFVKHDLRARRYVRYMDDFVIFGSDKAQLHASRAEITDFLHTHLGLRLNSKTQVFPLGGPRGRALDFLGYRMWPGRRRLRRGSVVRMRRKLKRMARNYHDGEISRDRIDAVIAAWMGHARHADSESIRAQLFGDFVLTPARHREARGKA